MKNTTDNRPVTLSMLRIVLREELGALEDRMGKRIVALEDRVNKRIVALEDRVNKRIDTLEKTMNNQMAAIHANTLVLVEHNNHMLMGAHHDEVVLLGHRVTRLEEHTGLLPA